MINARIIYADGMEKARDEIIKIGVDKGAIPWLLPKAIHLMIKLEDISCYCANVIKQEILSAGGDAAVHKGSVNCSTEKTDVLIMGTFDQLNRLVYKLGMQSGILDEIAMELKLLLDTIEKPDSESFVCGKYKLGLGEKTYVMGILNVTPDSFSDGGKYFDTEEAVKKAKQMVEDGADIIDIGGESTRPGHKNVGEEEELSRVLPVIERLSKEIDIPVSVDTSKAAVAEKVLKAGANIINDVWGLQKDAKMAGVISKYNAGVVMMHNKEGTNYSDLMGNILKFLRESVEIAEYAGINRNNMAIDPGIGFGKTLEQNLEIMLRLRELKTLGLAILLGTSRKSMIGNVLELPVNERIEGTAATVTLGIANHVDIVRVHDVKEMVRVVKMTDAMVRG
ncbi:MAG: dihydropteroate synthase [Clostridia bacterium]|jgi:dihydropteroate synthase